MKTRKLFGKEYRYAEFLSEKDTLAYLSGEKTLLSDALIASLSVGVLKIEAVLYKIGVSVIPRYEIFIKAGDGSAGWICYDSPDTEVRYGEGRLEREMFRTLDAARKKKGLSYDHADFKTLDGKAGLKKENTPSQ
jgi:hypothetical protein